MDRRARGRPVVIDQLRVDHGPADLEGVVLQRIAVALEPAARLRHRLALVQELQPGERLALVDELLVGHARELEEAPPKGLFFAAVPIEQLREEPAILLRRRSVGCFRGDIGSQHRDGRGDLPLMLARLTWFGGLCLLVGARDRPTDAPRQLGSPFLQPVAEAKVADDVVAVVAGDRTEDVLADLAVLGRSTLEPGLERDDARAGAAQLDLALEPVQRLEPLDRVALDARPNSVSYDRVEIDE